MNLPSYFMDSSNLGGIGTVGWRNYPLAKPGVKTFTHLSLKLPRNCPVQEVYWSVIAFRIVWVNGSQ